MQPRHRALSCGPPNSWTSCIGASANPNSASRSKSRASAVTASAGRPAGALVEGRDQAAVEVDSDHPVAPLTQVKGDATGPAAKIEDRARGRFRKPLPDREIGR